MSILPASDSLGSGPAIVLIHGFPLDRRIWRPQLLPLSQAGYRVIAPDLPGFGGTPPREDGASMRDYADSIMALLDAMQIERAVIGGMSMGGYVLFDLVERFPERIAGALFIVTRAGGDDAAGKERRRQQANLTRQHGVGPVVEFFTPLLFAPPTLSQRPELVATVRSWMDEGNPQGLAQALLAMAERPDRTPTLAAIATPTLAIGATLDRAIPPQETQTLAAGIAGARLCLLDNAGHLANMEEAASFNASVLNFLQTLPPW